MCTPEILKLAEVIKDYEENIMNGKSKLILSADLLTQLNNCFCLLTERDIMSTSFNKVNTPKTDFTHLEYLHNFFEKTISLKLTQSKEKEEFTNISEFKNLKLLEINKLDIKKIKGIQKLRNKLQQLTCFRCLENLGDVLKMCGGDESDGGSWSELRTAIFTHNYLKEIDYSFEFAQNLNTLNLSHNEISNVQNLNCLVNLKYLNLGYNKLVNVPTFSGHICNRLRVLILRNNFIEDINAISNLSNLNELDLRENCLIEHNCLIPLAHLAALQWINLLGNPLSYHPQHRNKSSCCLHISTNSVVLDGQVLNKNEQRLVGMLHPRPKKIPPVQNNSLDATIQKKQRNIRNIDMEESNNSLVIEIPPSLTLSHTETQNIIEQLYNDYETKLMKTKPDALLPDPFEISENTGPVNSTPYGSATTNQIIDELELERELIVAEECSKLEVTAEVYVTATDIPQEENISLYDAVVEEVKNVEADEVSEDELEDGEESLFVVTYNDEPIMLIITKTHIFEGIKEGSKERVGWDIDTILTSELKDHEVHITFDTYKTYKKQRTYLLEDKKEAQRFHTVLQEIIKNKTVVKEFTSMSCMKCNHKFKIKGNYITEKRKCPACDSTLCIVDEK